MRMITILTNRFPSTNFSLGVPAWMHRIGPAPDPTRGAALPLPPSLPKVTIQVNLSRLFAQFLPSDAKSPLHQPQNATPLPSQR